MAHKKMNWSENEEENLARAWVAALEDPVTRPNFWIKVGNIFQELMGCQNRSVDEICSKYRDMKVKCVEFNGIYNFVINNVHEGDPFVVAM